MNHEGKTIAVVGATGLQGSAVSRRLLDSGWRVLALTRDPSGTGARALAALGAEVVRADSEDRLALERSFAGAHGVYSVQNHHISGYDGEIRQGKNVADAAVASNVHHLVYGSTGNGVAGTGIGSWDAKVAVAEHARGVGAPLTVLRPTAFMELMTEKRFYPQASVWHVMPKIMGDTRSIGWITVEDLAVIVEKAFADPATFVGRDLSLAGDVLSIQQCREVWREVVGRPPRRFPMPVRLFERFTGTDETTMWKWLRENDMRFDTQPTREIHPDARTLRAWLAQRSGT
jgi:uncharacterized protein YbjT (DUF2867 family)